MVGLVKITGEKNKQQKATCFCHTIGFTKVSDGKVCPKNTIF